MKPWDVQPSGAGLLTLSLSFSRYRSWTKSETVKLSICHTRLDRFQEEMAFPEDRGG